MDQSVRREVPDRVKVSVLPDTCVSQQLQRKDLPADRSQHEHKENGRRDQTRGEKGTELVVRVISWDQK